MGIQVETGKFFMNQRHSAGKSSIKYSSKGRYPGCLEKNWKDKHYSSICHGNRIFPVESRSSCITTGSKHLMHLMSNCHTEGRINGEKVSVSENAEEVSKSQIGFWSVDICLGCHLAL